MVKDINKYLELKGIRFSNELRMGIGIPDISLNIGANYRLKPVENYFLLSILNFLNKKQTASFYEIKKEFLLSVQKVKQYVSILVNMSLVKIKNEFVRIIKNVFSTNLGTTISIEAKLKDWKGACLQAERYLCFSDYSYVAMPQGYIKNVDDNLFIHAGIGLLAINGSKIEEIISAKRSETCDYTLKYMLTSKILEKSSFEPKRHLRNNIFSYYAIQEN